jgi:Cu/Ag efflux pump CusA
MSTTISTNNNGYNDANHSNNDHEPSTSYYMLQESLYHSLDEQNNANTLDNESKLSTILHQSHTIRNMTTYIYNQLKYIYRKETLLVEVLIVIMLAKIYPRIGTEFVFPEITAHWIAVMTIFCKSFSLSFSCRVLDIFEIQMQISHFVPCVCFHLCISLFWIRSTIG